MKSFDWIAKRLLHMQMKKHTISLLKLTCNLTFAVSSGNVTRSAKQAARPALKNFVPNEWSMTAGLEPEATILTIKGR